MLQSRFLCFLGLVCAQFNSYAFVNQISAESFLKNYETGKSLLADALHNKQLITLLKDDHARLLGFPFGAYELKHISNFGFIYLDPVDDYIKNFLRNNVPWERAFITLITQSVKAGSVAIDIGAHIGTHDVTLSHAVGPQGVVYAFEPSNKIFAELYMNMHANRCDNVIPLHCALGNEEGVMKIRTDVPYNEGGSYVMKAGEGQEIIMLRLDDFHFSNVSFIKIDTENTELEVLLGAYNTIMANRPIIFIEIQGNSVRAERHQENMQERALQVQHFLQWLNYEVHHLGNADYIAFPKAFS